ncbi:MAG: spore coat protein [Candidatus Yanofskybacteria bacterium RIFCSPHIGHO2_02_FULL_41_29]|uniref:glucose-1-phosphate thymidylyltransferase n=1 Tax=Candidatus Yanofskybacteria bacterium RIFCSPHIGHO2_01_FULL_41_53 TaxID=1802663 RepID=A0A1F8ELS5_9BACT|nr:MAG: spore coat protein [Candidatus Yanofskybacteria bacterium RIFCSPHIGHO2_01_FULL_41_53]OGN12173.1 MAG: spore coat protein [Candidatus Yanofskybacteria bacterium RIFCSPHIGHO2_02_FULL_41_29]OGN23674.1 MAG: spore coat protein [Candidatus Yanofskybacteria bacterium RIFCSPLOWO2_01_FULL_41_67]OGN29232.1 MAG: spore coat protein [Candidatus Yanofskybacteria bacterium RIFCSPLOWO2_02_FULL_41_13]OGN34820.1 MAG: spore coat protein [Candidatus Yanofskybacteria bacterium RIFCSPLOWO2_12_FULL_41_8]
MRGIVLAGGSGTRLSPLTKITSKQLLPVYDKPMVFYPLNTLLRAGIKDILIIVSPEHPGDFLKLLGSGKEFGAKFTYEIQDKPEGLAQAFIIAKDFIGDDNVAMILGDNIFEDDFSKVIKKFKKGGHIFAKKVSDPERFGVVKFGKKGRAIQIEEKPKKFLSDYAITGLYIYDNRVVEVAKKLKPSLRGELEITDLHNWYLNKGELKVDIVKGLWIDAGTFDSLAKATQWALRQDSGQAMRRGK